uniref:Titin-like n=1 Tax=Saccoglossus kowalevskii TaxID=10224 RepID=A0ABM0MSM1_SACKO|nr:PREDICTED: titin-like [Saccoglossus kowalevskii]
MSDPPGSPSKPDISNITARSATLKWKAPKDDGGSPVTEYVIERKEQFSARWTMTDTSTSTTTTVHSLNEGTEYYFRVAAVNKAGVGKPGEPSVNVVAKAPYTVPDAPRKPQLPAVSANKMNLTWNTPLDDGGAPVIGYIIERREKFDTRWTRINISVVPETSYTADGLKEGTEYEFRVAAENKAGVGKFSEPTAPTIAKHPYDVPDSPGRPDIIQINAHDMTITWSPPVSDGGSPIIGYIVELLETAKHRWIKVTIAPVRETTYTVTELITGAEYKLRVSALNAAGVGKPSPDSVGRIAKPPYDVPGPPAQPRVTTADSTSMALKWFAPDEDGGSPVTGYTIEKRVKFGRWSRAMIETVEETFATVSELVQGQEYEFRVCAENKAGVGEASEPSDPRIAKPPYDVPSQPGTTSVSDVTANSMILNWTPPESTGGAAVTGYYVEKKDKFATRWTRVNATPMKATMLKVSDLLENNEYVYRVLAENKAGLSSPSQPSRSVVAKPPYGLPMPPGKPNIVAADCHEMTVTWTPPVNDGGSPVTGYYIDRKDCYSSRWMRASRDAVLDTTFTVTGLSEGTAYQFRVAAENKAGVGKPSEASELKTAKAPYDPPEAPGMPQISNINKTNMTLTWTKPKSDGGAPITNYIIEKKEAFGFYWSRVNFEEVLDTSYKVTGLTEGTKYQFKIAAENKAGVGPYSNPSEIEVAKSPYQLASPPGKPVVSDVTETSMTLSWTKPTSDGGADITGFIVERRERFSTRWQAINRMALTDTTFKATGLSEGNQYEFRVCAENAAGVGTPSEASEAHVAKPPYDVPGQPGSPSVSGVDASFMTITWTPPVSDGGAPITGYIIEKKDTSKAKWTLATRKPVKDLTYTVTDLIQGTRYEFRVSAENKAGVGKPSYPSAAKVAKPPYDAPDSPSTPMISNVDSTEMTLSWTPPTTDGGNPVTGYIIEAKASFATRWHIVKTAITGTMATVTHLKEGHTYEFRVIAENKAGLGKPSSPSEARLAKPPYDVPAAPGSPEVSNITNTSVTLNWSPPSSDGGSPVIGYIIEKKDRFATRYSKAEQLTTSATKATIHKLAEGNIYEFRILAENKAGFGKPSEPSVPITPKPKYVVPSAPGVPSILDVTSSTMAVTWTPPVQDGGAHVTGYIIEKRDVRTGRWTKAHRDVITDTTFTVKDLIEDSKYEFRVSAENAAGVGKPSEPSAVRIARPPYDVPDAPGKPEITSYDINKASITWTPPISDGGSRILGYIIERKEKHGTRWMKANRDVVTGTSFTVTGLIEKSVYEFRVMAENKAGVGKPSQPSDYVIAKLPYDVPSSPGLPNIDCVTGKTMTLTWSKPSSDGGSPITGYYVEKKDQGTMRWARVNRFSVADLTLSVGDLREGHEYEFRVTAENKAGIGKSSEIAGPRVAKPPYDVPGMPGTPDVTEVTARSITISWTRPASDGGSPITSYIIEKKEPFTNRWTFVHKVPETTSMVTGLHEYHEYEFRVAAENRAGIGKPSYPSKSTVAKPPYDIPGAPSKPAVSDITDTSMTLTWRAPAADGGAAIIGYYIEKKERFEYRWTPVNQIAIPELTYTVSGLISHSEYEFRVMAENKAGLGPPSEATAPMLAKPPYDVPSPPSQPSIDNVTKTTMTLSWKPPTSDGGSKVLGYVIEKKDGFSIMWEKAHREDIHNTSYTVTDLKESREYMFRVSAFNKAGIGSPSQSSQTRLAKAPYDVPGAPEKPELSNMTNSTMTLTWLPPLNDGGAPITGYIVEKSERYSTHWVRMNTDVVKTTTYTATSLRENIDYQFRVAAENKAGIGKSSRPTEPRAVAVAPQLDTSKIKDTVVVKVDNTFHLDVPYRASPKPTVTWLKDGLPLDTSFRVKSDCTDRSTILTTKNCVRADSGTYTLKLSNEAGDTSTTVRVEVLDRPAPPKNLMVSDINSTQVTLSWEPPRDDGGSKVTHYVIEKRDMSRTVWARITNVTDTTHRVTNLMEGYDYGFRIIAVNKVGESEPVQTIEKVHLKSKYDKPGPPSMPEILSVGSDYIELSWEPPSFNGGTPITGYFIEKRDRHMAQWNRVNLASISETSCIVNRLLKGSEYEFCILAENKAGVGQPSQPSQVVRAVEPAVAPKLMLDVKYRDTLILKAGTTFRIDVPYKASPIPTIKWSKDGVPLQSSWRIRLESTEDHTAITVKDTDRSDGGHYTLHLTNEAGSDTANINVQVLDKPGTPRGPLEASNIASTSVTLSWLAPRDDGGSPITNYIIEKRDTTHYMWSTVTSDQIDTSYRVTHLTEDSQCQFRVMAQNRYGISEPLESERVVPRGHYDVPGSPSAPDVTETTGESMLLTWNEPSHDGGAHIIGYIIEMRQTTSPRWIKATGLPVVGTTFRVSRLTRGAEYEFRILAENKAGVSLPSGPSRTVRAEEPAVAPKLKLDARFKKPIIVKAGTTFHLEASYYGVPMPTVKWTKDDHIAASSLRVRVDASDSSSELITFNSEPEDSGVYQISVSNKAGSDRAAFTVKVVDRPSPPRGPMELLSVTSTNVTLAWQPPANDGSSPIINYILERRETASRMWTKVPGVKTDTTMRVGNLIEGMEYQFRVSAENMYGVSEPLVSDRVRPKSEYDVPGQPGIPEVSNVHADSMTLTWSAPGYDGGTQITGYYLEKKERMSTMWSRVSLSVIKEKSYRAIRLIRGAEYEFRVSAENKAGIGKPSAPSVLTKAKEPAVASKIRLPSQYTDVVIVKAGTMLRLDIPISGVPEPTVIWYKDGQVMKTVLRVRLETTEHGCSLLIKQAERRDGGEYVVQARNEAGTDTATITVMVLDKPGPPQPPLSFSNITKASVTLEWQPPLEDGGSEITNYILEKRDHGRTLWSRVSSTVTGTKYTVTSLLDGTAYQFRVMAQNQYGISEALEGVEPVLVRSPYDVPLRLSKILLGYS